MDVLSYTLMIAFVGESVIGISGNGFIAVVNIMAWVKRRKLSSVYQILTLLAISRIALYFFASITMYVIYWDLSLSRNMGRTIIILWTMLNHFNLWLATCLSVFYFLKLANFSNSAFLYLKWRVNKVVLVTFLGSLMFLLSHIIAVNAHVGAWILETKNNVSYSSSWDTAVDISKHLLITDYIFALIPFAVSLMTFLLLFFSLWRHLKNTQNNRGDSSTTAIKALQTVTTFLSLYATVLLIVLVLISRIEMLEKTMMILYDHLLGVVFPSLHSCVLILVDTKLRQASLKVLCCLMCILKGSQHFES